MEISPYAIAWVSYCWFVAVVTVIALMVYGVHTLTDQRILAVAQNVGRVARKADTASRRIDDVAQQIATISKQFLTLIEGLELNLPKDDEKPGRRLEISASVLAEMASTWQIIESEAVRLGVTTEELMREVARVLAERKKK